MHVWSSVGAVAVYSRTRVALIVVLVAVVLVGAGMLVGAALGDNSGGGSPDVPASRLPVPSAPAVRTAAPTDPPPPSSASLKKAYRRGFVAGGRHRSLPSVLRRPGAYVVRVKGHAIVQQVPVRAGATYYLCAGATRLCIKSGG